MTILNLRPRRFAAVVLFSSLTFLSAAYAQQASSPLSPLLAEMEGRWSVEQTTWDGPGGPGRKGTPAVATRKIPPGGGFIEENMTAAASGPDSFTRTAQINYNVTAKAFEYSTIDSRAPQQMHYRSQAAATTFKGDLALSGGKFVAAEWGGKKNVAFAYRVALSPVTDGRQRLQIFFRPLTGRTAEFLALNIFIGGYSKSFRSAAMRRSGMANETEVTVPIMTTLHYVIQTQRMGTIAETTGRSASFLQATSMALVALGFIAPATNFSLVFFTFALILLSLLLVIGFITFLRCVQLGVEDSRLALQADEVIRFYLETAPRLESRMRRPNSSGDPGASAVGAKIPGQTLLTSASLIAFVEAAIGGVIIALAFYLFSENFVISSLAGIGFALLFASVLLWAQRLLWLRATSR